MTESYGGSKVPCLKSDDDKADADRRGKGCRECLEMNEDEVVSEVKTWLKRRTDMCKLDAWQKGSRGN